MESDPTRMCDLLVGLPDVDVIGVDAPVPGQLVVAVEARESRPTCDRCQSSAWVKDRRAIDLGRGRQVARQQYCLDAIIV